jgi:hypothetical protein
MKMEIEKEIENPEEGIERLFPNQEIISEIAIWPNEDLNIWQAIISEMHLKVGFPMVRLLFYNGKDSEALKYILPYRRAIKGWTRLLLERKISRRTFEDAIAEVEKKFVSWETPIKKNIDKKEDVEEIQKKAVKLLLEHGVDLTIKSITNGSGKHKPRTKILEPVSEVIRKKRKIRKKIKACKNEKYKKKFKARG